MSEIIQLCYIITIFVGVGAWSMQMLARGKNLSASNRLLKSAYTSRFLELVVVFNVCDFLVLFMNSWLGERAVLWVLVAENILEVCLAYILIEMEREYFNLKENRNRFIFFTLIAAALLWVDVAFTVGMIPMTEQTYLVCMLGLNLLPVMALVIFTMRNLKQILSFGKAAMVEGYFLFYNLVFFLLCLITTISILDTRTSVDYVGNDREIYLIFWVIFNVMNYILIWRSCKVVDEETAEVKPTPTESLEEMLIKRKLEYGLSDREVEIARLLCKGKNNNDIASDLFVSPNTVKVHTSNLYKKLGVKNRVQAVQVLHGEEIESME